MRERPIAGKKRARDDSDVDMDADGAQRRPSPRVENTSVSRSCGPLIELNSGRMMPAFGLGTFRCKGKACIAAVRGALRSGIRLVDTASSYNNEREVAEGIAVSGVPRNAVFIVTKVGRESMKDAESVSASVHASLGALQTDYIDLVLVHWPGTANSNTRSPVHAKARRSAWAALEILRTRGVVRDIGVSNFNAQQLEELLEVAKVVPAVVQVEVHPYLPEVAIREQCTARRIVVQAYTSLGRCEEPPRCVYGVREPNHPRLVRDPTVLKIAMKLNLTPPQVLLRWALQRGMAVVPKMSSDAHRNENCSGIVGCTSVQTALPEEALRELDDLTGVGKPPPVRYAYPAQKFPQ